MNKKHVNLKDWTISLALVLKLRNCPTKINNTEVLSLKSRPKYGCGGCCSTPPEETGFITFHSFTHRYGFLGSRRDLKPQVATAQTLVPKMADHVKQDFVVSNLNTRRRWDAASGIIFYQGWGTFCFPEGQIKRFKTIEGPRKNLKDTFSLRLNIWNTLFWYFLNFL